LAVAASGGLGVQSRTISSRLRRRSILTLKTKRNGVGVGVDDRHLGPHVSGAGLAEVRLSDQVALEVSDVTVEHGESDDRGDDSSCRDDDGEESHTSHLSVFF